jgi:hypothetical protein
MTLQPVPSEFPNIQYEGNFLFFFMFSAEVEFKGKQAGGRIYRPCFRENKPKTLV